MNQFLHFSQKSSRSTLSEKLNFANLQAPESLECHRRYTYYNFKVKVIWLG